MMRLFSVKTMVAACLVAGASAAHADTTGSTGGGVGYNNMQPSLVLGQYVETLGIYPSRDGGASFGLLGQIRTFAYGSPAFFSGTANGQIQSIVQNTALFSLLGTNFGGNGVNNFALPNLVGTTTVGVGAAPGAAAFDVGTLYGNDTNVLTMAQMATHEHDSPGVNTGPAGGSQPINDYQASLGVSYGIVAEGAYGAIPGNGVGAIGQVEAFASNFVPGGLLAANGQLLQIDQYSALFSLIGTTYGGDGLTTFALPNLNGHAVVGTSSISDATHLQMTLGQDSGVAQTTLTDATMPAHTHTLPDGSISAVEGGNQPFTNVQPSLGLNYLIATTGIFPTRDRSVSEDPLLGEIIMYASNNAIPNGYMLADGRLLQISQNQALFALLGTTYGGDGIRTFALPDLRGRTIVGAGIGTTANAGIGTAYTIGQVLGTTNVQLTVNNLPPHVHSVDVTAAVPEPGTWGMMLVGFAAVGVATRSRRRKAVPAL